MRSFRQDPGEMEKLLEFLGEDLENVRRVVSRCEEEGLDVEFEVHPVAETAQQSVEYSDVELSQIVKTLVFIGEEPVAVLCPGDREVSESLLEEELGTGVRLANPDEVEDATGYVVGGVSPFDLDIPVLIEESIMEHEEVRPAAGSRVIGAAISPGELKETTGGKTMELS
ncbi:MAG: YbaK/EbsC family protein [Candidatus Nanohaloarchaea archaeon]